MLSKISDNIKLFHRAGFELEAPEAVIKGIFNSPYCCYGNLLHHKNESSVFANDWAAF